ncbi:DsrE family protein [Clostridium butyricum]|uniref:Uncharacterized protein n=1 Tax=Clostridium butyricum E4 str. BoNT E BL5262 TaxID=632245 RepID=C4ILY1_CLOBU|nr:DsrE family protein [Clostridium butyricum]APF24023.1 dsrE/DsrF-like family protein [Clostridium butyricum]EDT74705.1 conserved hypothetical protein [Clostridium butyricum 5521]EEP52878.1 conserved hypothetical protein [Clostridium butyricum E4 str. BoNT E BL5262]NFL29951.1 hypothetical protein [Clostridium butyricum]NFS17442.1 hypothetical protein [Clostridium butyricum]
MKVLFHIDQESKWKMVLENVKNMIKTGKELGDTFEIEIIANGIAVMGVQEHVSISSKLYLEFEEILRDNVKIKACNNALKKFGIEKSCICSFVEVVPAGVIEIAKKHEEGYCYIKA